VTEHRLEAPGENGNPIPRDLPDQQATGGDDPWDAGASSSGRADDDEEEEEEARTAEPEPEPATDVPDTDEAGTGRQGDPRSDTVHPEHPGPKESPG